MHAQLSIVAKFKSKRVLVTDSGQLIIREDVWKIERELQVNFVLRVTVWDMDRRGSSVSKRH